MPYRPQIKTANGLVDFPLDAETVKGKTILEQTYPVGAIYLSVNNTSPASLFGGTWQQLKDRFLLGAGDTYTNGSTGGEATHQLSVNEMPSHRHLQMGEEGNAIRPLTSPVGNITTSLYGARFILSGAISSYGVGTDVTGGNQAHNNMPPYLVVYIWKRTA